MWFPNLITVFFLFTTPFSNKENLTYRLASKNVCPRELRETILTFNKNFTQSDMISENKAPAPAVTNATFKLAFRIVNKIYLISNV